MKKKIIIAIIITLCIIFCLKTTVEIRKWFSDGRVTIKVVNKTDSTLYVITNTSNFISKENRIKLYDTIYSPNDMTAKVWIPSERLERNSQTILNIVPPDTGKIYFFFIKEKIIATKKWEIICDSNLYVKSIALSYDELKSKKMTLNYQ
jgi:hypothetical protein